MRLETDNFMFWFLFVTILLGLTLIIHCRDNSSEPESETVKDVSASEIPAIYREAEMWTEVSNNLEGIAHITSKDLTFYVLVEKHDVYGLTPHEQAWVDRFLLREGRTTVGWVVFMAKMKIVRLLLKCCHQNQLYKTIEHIQ